MDEQLLSGSTPLLRGRDTSRSDMNYAAIVGAVGLGALVLWALNRRNKFRKEFATLPLKPAPPTNSRFGPIPPVDTENGVEVRLMSPWGQFMDLYFSPDEWAMVYQLSAMSKEPIEKIIIDVAIERKKMGLL